MNRYLLASAVFTAAIFAGCGADDSEVCGSGTMAQNGVCVPTSGDSCGSGTKDDGSGHCVPDGTVTCTDGTTLDTTSGNCVIDPTSCQGGTVLVNGACQDPTKGLHVDLEEGAEPNGLGVEGIEANSSVPAGTITLHAVGSAGVVVHGHITPFQDEDGDGQNDADLDTYVINVTAPTLLDVTADGVNGLAAGFIAFANVGETDPLSNWYRGGINLASDTSQRQLFLPRAGQYLLAIADTRTVFANGAPAGGPNAEYYLTITQLAIPTPTALTPVNSTVIVNDTIGTDATKFYTVAMGTGLNSAVMSASSISTISSLVLLDNNTFRSLANGGDGENGAGSNITTPATLVAGGFAGSDTALVVADTELDYALGAVPFTLTITTGTADAIPAAGSGDTQPEIGQAGDGATIGQSIGELDQWYVDITTAGQTLGMNLAWQGGNGSDVDGAFYDQDGNVIAPFSTNGGQFLGADSEQTWETFNGLIRFPAPGRYYLVAYEPAGAPGTSTLTLTSHYDTITPIALTIDPASPTTTDVTEYGANLYSYTPGTTVPWQQFTIATNNTPFAFGSAYPSNASGALTPYSLSDRSNRSDADPMFTLVSDDETQRIVTSDPASWIFVVTAGPGIIILAPPPSGVIDDVDDNPQVTVVPQSVPDVINLGAIAAGASGSNSGALGGSIVGSDPTSDNYYYTAPGGSLVTITVHPGPDNGTMQADVDLLDEDLDSIQGAQSSGSGQDLTFTFIQSGSGWGAFNLSDDTNDGGPYTVTVSVVAQPGYAVSTGTTVYADACAGDGSALSLDGDLDNGVTEIDTPAGFSYYGVAQDGVGVDTDGYLTFFDSDPFMSQNVPLPVPYEGTLIAPYWTNLQDVQICTKTSGTQVIVQWTGHVFGNITIPVAFQAILDSSDNSIEFVYAATQKDSGADATIGIQNSDGTKATELGYDKAGTIVPGMSKKLTPN